MSEPEPQFLDVAAAEDGTSRRIAYRTQPPVNAGGVSLLWLSGFASDMASTKATAVAEFAGKKGYGCTRFDYSGHGLSSGRFDEGTIGAWLSEAVAVFEKVTEGPQIVIGSSMGGHIALLLLRALLREAPEEAARIRALILIAPAWDMTEELMWKAFPEAAQRELMETGVYLEPSDYGEPYTITRALIEEGRKHLFKREPFDPGRPVVILQGTLDKDVPIAHARELMGFLQGDQGEMVEISDGEHRLSRPQDLELLYAAIDRLAALTQP